MPWEPLLELDDRQRAQEAIQAIAADLTGELPDIASGCLADGAAGLALFYGWLSAAGGERRFRDLAHRWLDLAVRRSCEAPGSLSLHGGVTGTALCCFELHRLVESDDYREFTSQVDELVAESLEPATPRQGFDLIYGLVGQGVYALAHPDEVIRRHLLRDVLGHLERSAEEDAAGICWRTPHHRLHPLKASGFSQGRLDLGLAHGTAGVVAFLGQVAARTGLDVAHLLRRATSWMLSHRRTDGGRSAFAGFLDQGDRSCRSAWCYGDPGVAVALYSAGDGLGDTDLLSTAVEVAKLDARRDPAESGVVDAGLCHGAAGLGHLFHRLYRATGDAELRDAARSWFGRTLAMRQPQAATGGFTAYWTVQREWRPCAQFLNGSSGVGLALLAASTAVEPTWDRALLLDLPGRGAAG